MKGTRGKEAKESCGEDLEVDRGCWVRVEWKVRRTGRFGLRWDTAGRVVNRVVNLEGFSRAMPAEGVEETKWNEIEGHQGNKPRQDLKISN